MLYECHKCIGDIHYFICFQCMSECIYDPQNPKIVMRGFYWRFLHSNTPVFISTQTFTPTPKTTDNLAFLFLLAWTQFPKIVLKEPTTIKTIIKSEIQLFSWANLLFSAILGT
jgi:hypothetical protein